jgi:hypothetical protein
MLQGQTHSINFFLILPSVLWSHTMHTHFKTSNNRTLCCMLNHGDTLLQFLFCLSLSSCQFESTFTPPAQLLLLESQPADLIRHHLWLLKALERISWLNCELLCATNMSHHKQETFIYECPLLCFLMSTEKRTREHCSSVIYSASAAI